MNQKDNNYALPALPNLPPLQLNMPPLPASLANPEPYDSFGQYAHCAPFATSPLQSPMQLHSQMPPQFHPPFHFLSSTNNYHAMSPPAPPMFHPHSEHHHDDTQHPKHYPHDTHRHALPAHHAAVTSNVQIYDINPDVVSESASSNSSHYSHDREPDPGYTHIANLHEPPRIAMQYHAPHSHVFAADYAPPDIQQRVHVHVDEEQLFGDAHNNDSHDNDNINEKNAAHDSVCNIKCDMDATLEMQSVCSWATSVTPKQEEMMTAEQSKSSKKPKKRKSKKESSNKGRSSKTKKEKEKGKETKKGQMHVCGECGKEFKYKSHLQRHLASHTKTKPFECKTCGKSFGHQYYLQDHIRYNHVKDAEADRKHCCSICSKTFRLKINLTNHMRIHTGEKPFKCGNCSKCFTQKGNCDAHYRACIGIKPFVCDTCHKTFTRKMYLQQHERTHTGIKPFKCDFCEKCFAIKSNMVKHKKARHKAEQALK